jgi:hypothetical protein
MQYNVIKVLSSVPPGNPEYIGFVVIDLIIIWERGLENGI